MFTQTRQILSTSAEDGIVYPRTNKGPHNIVTRIYRRICHLMNTTWAMTLSSDAILYIYTRQGRLWLGLGFDYGLGIWIYTDRVRVGVRDRDRDTDRVRDDWG